MARKSIKTNYYLFDASAREVVIPGGIQREQLILITNVTDNKVIYNFSDPELTATTYEISTDIRNVVTTRLVLAYDTTSMSDTDKLQIVYDDFEETMKPAETYMDSVNKQRVSTPQSQIDTDFEYGVQNTKWESLSMINNNPFAYKTDTPISVTSNRSVPQIVKLLEFLSIPQKLLCLLQELLSLFKTPFTMVLMESSLLTKFKRTEPVLVYCSICMDISK